MRTTIVGAGLVGLNIAHALLDEGHAVTLVDPGGREGRPSDGNAGWIAHNDILPLASPKVWRHLPRWLVDPLGPLAIRPAYLPKLLPWALRFVAASTPERIEAATRVIRALNATALPAWEHRLGALGLSHLILAEGALSVWRDKAGFAAAEAMLARQKAFGIAFELMDAAALKRFEPALTNVAAAAYYPTGRHVTDPAAVTAALRERAIERGAQLVADEARRIDLSGEAVGLVTEKGARLEADRLVIAAGIWSKPLAAEVGDRVPLDTERGYNATFPPGSFGLTRPVIYEGEGFVSTPLAIGDRVGGAVEFGGLEAAPNHARTEAIVRRLMHFLPHLDPALPAARWMGFRPSLPDSLPVIGPARRDRRVIHAFGHGHHGLTQAAATADLVAALVAGRAPALDIAPFSPQRFG